LSFYRLLSSSTCSGFYNQLQGFQFRFGKQAFSFGFVHFSGLRPFWSSQAFKIGYIFFCKSFGKFSSGFFVKFVCLGKVHFSQSQFFNIGFGKFSALAFFQFSLGFNRKVGLVKICGACKIKSQ
jgi:hypothetical protein